VEWAFRLGRILESVKDKMIPSFRRARVIGLTVFVVQVSCGAVIFVRQHGNAAARNSERDSDASALTPPDPKVAIRNAWQSARDAGSYRYNANVQQDLTPLAGPSMFGEQDQYATMQVNGEVRRPTVEVLGR
jgi:hypothetical protein